MADLRITQLPPLDLADVEATADLLAVADVSASETKKAKIADVVSRGLPAVADGSIPGSKLAPDSVTAVEIAPGAVGASELAALSVGSAALQVGSVSGSANPALPHHIVAQSVGEADLGGGSVSQRVIATGAVVAAAIGTGQVSGSGGGLSESHIDPKSITAADIAANTITGGELAASAVGAAALDADSVSGSATSRGKVHIEAGSLGTADLADNSVTNAKLATGLDGNKLLDGSVSNTKLTGGIAPAKLADTTGAAEFLAGPTAGPGGVTARRIVSTDLPTAGVGARGAVSVDGQGLRVAGDRLELDVDVTASATPVLVSFNAKGLVTGSSAIRGTDLPTATTTTIGGVSVPAGSGLTVDGNGALGHGSAVTAGGAPFVNFNSTGHITGSRALLAADIPGIDASQVVSGEFGNARLADRSVTALKLADYATAFIQDTLPPTTGNTIGQLWLNPLAQQIRMWDGNVWVPIGVGALSEQNLRFCGLFDARDGKITILTPFGRDAGYKVGDVLPVATDQLTGSYFVAVEPGNGTAVTTGITYDAGDWCVCLGTAQGWARIDTLNGSGGGGGTSTLDGLIDVDVPTPGAGQVLTYDGAIWKPIAPASATETVKGIIELATQAEVDAGTDAARAVTPATLKQYVATASPAPSDASETVKGILELATVAEVTAGTDTVRAVTPAGAKAVYLPLNITTLTALP